MMCFVKLWSGGGAASVVKISVLLPGKKRRQHDEAVGQRNDRCWPNPGRQRPHHIDPERPVELTSRQRAFPSHNGRSPRLLTRRSSVRVTHATAKN